MRGGGQQRGLVGAGQLGPVARGGEVAHQLGVLKTQLDGIEQAAVQAAAIAQAHQHEDQRQQAEAGKLALAFGHAAHGERQHRGNRIGHEGRVVHRERAECAADHAAQQKTQKQRGHIGLRIKRHQAQDAPEATRHEGAGGKGTGRAARAVEVQLPAGCRLHPPEEAPHHDKTAGREQHHGPQPAPEQLAGQRVGVAGRL
jgi:hypothetical protein